MNFLLDTNVFIEAKNRYYAFDICPGFWDWMDSACGVKVASIVNVREELTRGDDELSAWAHDRKDAEWFLKVDDSETQVNFGEIAAYISSGQYTSQAVAKFLDDADPWLIAKARSMSATVITHELPSPNSKKRVLIPDVCNAFDVKYINMFDALRGFSTQFTWSV
ncbi:MULTISPECIES: DUF4411 family protein [unclassified Rhizobium]|uniref:DUF4411 family protein n=1 Tax=unclassified Rhizobium TaxID=2613769 RepID=UPI0016207473|nr:MULTISPECIES: DUF4411 family protein [unclassified Rhizobium]MBB3286738.1 hypothetical protein [Rhizobium sp. BK252]MBB3401068.1 hypothetical protein [Rhizobium sp. BK289]MBB3413646.1 hypothetical protein [Rhizobium sp. BK284]MBB3481533.1 hypothetical protein [Rhizobium sp. BK347]MDK4719872.1 DUF4411 family protein [Rhizobium sp. CNPSo 3968]